MPDFLVISRVTVILYPIQLKKRLSAYESKVDSWVNRIGDILGYADPLKQKEYLEAVKSIHHNQ